jgi:hypothetical protein
MANVNSSSGLSFTGDQSPDLKTRILENTSVGEDAGASVISSKNVFVGKESGFHSKNVNNSIFIGYRTGYNTVNTEKSVYIGANTLKLNNSGNYNTIVGTDNGINLINSDYNTIFGYSNLNSSKILYNNSIIGNKSADKLNNSFDNIIIGSYSANQLINANSNLFIGNYNNTYNNIINDTITLGNTNQISNSSIVLGNYNNIKSVDTISIGNQVNSINVAIFNYPLLYHDINLILIAKSRLNLKHVNINPINNLFYESLYNPEKISNKNNIDIKNVEFNIKRHEFHKENNNNIFEPKLNLNNLINFNKYFYKISEPFIIPANDIKNNIDFGKLNKSLINPNINYEIYIIEYPKYGYLENNRFNLNDITNYIEYSEYKNIEYDYITFGFIIQTLNLEPYFSKNNFELKITRNFNLDKFIVTDIYTNLYSHLWHENEFTLIKNNSTIFINNNIVKVSEISIYNTFRISNYEDKSTILINNNIVQLNKPTNNFLQNSLINENYNLYLFSNNKLFIGELNNIDNLPNKYYIYIEQPPKFGYINNNLILVESNNNFIEIDYTFKESKSDEFFIRLLNETKTSINTVTIKITLKNYIINHNKILTDSLINDNYYLLNGKVNHYNNNYILDYINNCNLFNTIIYDPLDNIKEQINTGININNINIDIYPFNTVSIYQKLIDYGFQNINESNIFIIDEPTYGYISDYNYINTTNENDKIEVVIALNNINYQSKNLYYINFIVKNNYKITYSTQYIYNNTYEIINSLFVENVNSNDISIYDINEESIINDKIVNFNNNDFIKNYNFRLFFGNYNKDYNIDIYPEIEYVIKQNSFYYSQFLETQIENNIEYIFKNTIYENFKIKLTVEIENEFEFELMNIYNNYKFIIQINNTNIIFDNNNIIYNNLNITNPIVFNKKTKIEITNNSLNIDDNKVIDLDINLLEKINLKYDLNENIQNIQSENIILHNYFLKINFMDFNVQYDINKGNNLLIGNSIISNGYNNVCLGNSFNMFGNESIIIGNNIGKIDNDFGIDNSLILGNNCFTNTVPRNTIAIGNNIYSNIDNLNLIEVNQLFSKKPILIGNDLEYNKDNILNINDSIIETSNSIIIGKDGKELYLKNINVAFNNIINRPDIFSGYYEDLINKPNFNLIYYTQDYINNNYYTLNYINNNYYNQNYINLNYLSKDEIENHYYSCNQINNNYYTAKQIDNNYVLKETLNNLKIEDLSGVSLGKSGDFLSITESNNYIFKEISKAGQSGDYNDLVNLPDLNKYVTNDNIISRNYVTEIYLNNKNYIKNTDSFKVDNNNNSESLITINKSIFKDVLNIKDESSSILYIENNGNIGIGTNKPNYKLDVNGIISGDGSKIKI